MRHKDQVAHLEAGYGVSEVSDRLTAWHASECLKGAVGCSFRVKWIGRMYVHMLLVLFVFPGDTATIM